MAKPQIFNRDMKRLAYLDNALAVGYGLETNSLWTATFTLPADDPKNAYCTPLNFVEIFDGDERIDLFRIIGEDMERSNGATRYYDCEHVLATLLSDVLFQYHQCGGSGVKTADVLNYILARQTRQNWKLGACDFKRYFEYNWENSTLLAALFAVPECFDSEYLWSWDTTVYPWTLSLTVPTEALKSEIRYAKNMTNIKKTTDATSIANRVYALGYGEGVNQLTIESANGGVPYVEDALSIERYGLCSTILVDSRYQVAENLKAYAEQILAGLKEPYVSYEIGAIDLHRLTGDKFSKFRPGEIVRVVDEADGINLRTRIVRVEKADAEGDPGNVTVTIANKTQDIAGSISDLQSRALISETYAQGATNQQIYNFSDNADATHPAKLQLYISDSVVRINKMLLNIEFEAFRAYEKAIGGGGGQTTSSGGGQTSGTTAKLTAQHGLKYSQLLQTLGAVADILSVDGVDLGSLNRSVAADAADRRKRAIDVNLGVGQVGETREESTEALHVGSALHVGVGTVEHAVGADEHIACVDGCGAEDGMEVNGTGGHGFGIGNDLGVGEHERAYSL